MQLNLSKMEMKPYVLHIVNGISPLQVSLDCFHTNCGPYKKFTTTKQTKFCHQTGILGPNL